MGANVSKGNIRPKNFLDKACFVFTGADLSRKGPEFRSLLLKEAEKAGKTGVSRKTVERWFNGGLVRNKRAFFFFLQILNDLQTHDRFRSLSEDRKRVLGLVHRFCELSLQLDEQNDPDDTSKKAVDTRSSSIADAAIITDKPKGAVRQLAASRTRMAIVSKGAAELELAVQKLLQASGKNQLPEGLEALHAIPITLFNIATAANAEDWSAMVRHIGELEAENRHLRSELEKLETKTRWNLFLDEAAKTAASWQAWTALGAVTFAVFGMLDQSLANEMIDCFNDYVPEKNEGALSDWSGLET